MTRIYVQRDGAGRVTGLSADATSPGAEAADLGDPDVRRFLGELDLDLVRVLEDVVDLLVAKGVFRFTDLPEAAQDKLMYRKSVRNQWRAVQNPLNGEEDLF
jgi:hypothetical protein